MPKRAAIASLGAVAGVCLLVLTWYAAFHIGFMQRADQSILRGFSDLSRPRVNAIANRIAHLCNPNPYVYLCALPFTIALLRRRPRIAAAIAAIILGANVTTQLLKPMLAAARPGPSVDGGTALFAASWPSGHATAAMSLTLCLVLALPARLRPAAAAAGAAFTVAVVYSFLTLGWHFPSDVLGGFLVAFSWTALVVACVWLADARRVSAHPSAVDSRSRPSLAAALTPPSLALLGAIALVALVALARPHAVVAYARTHTAFMVGAAAIAGAAFVIATAVMLVVSRAGATGSDRAPTAALRRRWPSG
jgi:membrane-associated phospholipid phosphatase